ncbi:MAG: bacterial Ig-like domain-containing protein [Clostridiales bacterium]|nr:bacterial Ig-like domain-containing protein [Clostridiales bacterium]
MIKKDPTKTTYTYRKDTNLDLSGMEAELTFTNGTKAILDPSECTVSGYSAKPAGKKTVTVEYEGLTAQFDVTVKYSFGQILIRIFLLGFLWY